MMPKISGFDMLDILRSTSETKNIKVIMMTALSSDDQRSRGEALGADRYLVKSQVGIEDVVRTVHDVLGDGVPGATPAPAAPSSPAPTPAAPATAPMPTPTPPPSAPTPAPAPTEPPVINLPSTPPLSTPTGPAPAVPSPDPSLIAPLPAAPAPAPTPTPTPPLPEPTAPFSSPRPASLGDRIINPIIPTENVAAPTDIASQMNQELNASLPPAQAPTPPPPPPPAAPTSTPPAPGAAL